LVAGRAEQHFGSGVFIVPLALIAGHLAAPAPL
jgi:hypothetical protein